MKQSRHLVVNALFVSCVGYALLLKFVERVAMCGHTLLS